ncbi:MAG: hypothetical protein IKM34_03665 [Clostridia bacterium]|nr:hypothetical protein [Clostridia bacterium]
MKQIKRLEDALGKIDDDLLFDAETVRGRKPRRHFAFFAAAACLTVILLAVPLGILIANQNETPEVPLITTSNTVITTATLPTTTIPPQTTRPSVLDIPGATLFEENKQNFSTHGGSPFVGQLLEFTQDQTLKWAERVKQENDVIVGYIKDYTSVLVPDGKAYYRISTMEIAVLEDISGIESETVTAVYANRYEWNGSHYKPVSKYFIGDGIYKDKIQENLSANNDMFEDALLCTEAYFSRHDSPIGAGLIFLKKAEDNSFTVGETSYQLSHYADYVLDACFQYDYIYDQVYFRSYYRTILLRFRPALLREVIQSCLAVEGNFSFASYTASDPHVSLRFRIYHSSDNMFPGFTSIFYDDLFIKNEKNQKAQVNPDYKWVVTIEGVKYEITSFDLRENTPSTTVFLDLGPDFSWSLFDYDENNQYTYQNVRLDIYDSDGNLLCYADLTNNYRFPGGYTHTLPGQDQNQTDHEKYDHIDIINDDGYEGLLDMGGSYFTFENAYAAFDNRPALVLSMTNSNSIFAYLFTTSLNPTTGNTTHKACSDYTWFVTIEGKQYEIKTILTEVEPTSHLVYLDLGPDFSWDLFDYDENGKYTFEEVRIDIYRYQTTLLYFANLTDDALYGGYTHTKPE